MFDQPGIVSVGDEPAAVGVVLHGSELGVVQIDPDAEPLQLGQSLLGHHVLDPLQVVGQGGERPLRDFPVLLRQQLRIDGDRPAFDLFLQGIGKRLRLLGRQPPGQE